MSTSCAAAFILSGFPGTNPTAITRYVAPARVFANSSTVSVATSRCLSSRPAPAETDSTFWTMAPLTTVLDSESDFFALFTSRTPATTVTEGGDDAARRARMF